MSGIDNAKKVMGWVSANARAACGNCDCLKQEDQPYGAPLYRCSKGGFTTSRYAICDQHEPKFLTDGSVPK